MTATNMNEVTLIQVRDALALHDNVSATQLSQLLAAPLPMIEAMLATLVALGKIKRVEADNTCLSANCQRCPTVQQCTPVSYCLVR